jgi:hypothetical protein
MFEKIGNMQQANDFNSSANFFLTFPIERLSERLSQVLGTAGQSKPFTLPSSLLSQQQYPIIAHDNGSRRITYSWNQIVHN